MKELKKFLHEQIHIDRDKIHNEIETFEDIEPKIKSRRNPGFMLSTNYFTT